MFGPHQGFPRSGQRVRGREFDQVEDCGAEIRVGNPSLFRVVLGHFWGQRMTLLPKAGKVDPGPSSANVWIHKDTKPHKVDPASS